VFSSTSVIDPSNVNSSVPKRSCISSSPPADSYSETTPHCISNTNNISTPVSYLVAEATINGIFGIVLLDTGSGLTIISSRHWSVIGDTSVPPTPYDGPDIHGPEGSSICPVAYVQVDWACP
jgi:hypothetical protein